MITRTLKKLFLVAITAAGFIACQSNSEELDVNYTDTTALLKDSSSQIIPADPAATQTQTTVVPPTATLNTNTAGTGLNPAHGQPGHRCDISVGAPLNSKPTTTPAVQQQPVAVTQNKTVTAPGMNPPHGEPGHRCEIAVGAPLNSKPTSPVVKDSSGK